MSKPINGCSECGYTHCRATHDAQHFKKLYSQWYREAKRWENLAKDWMNTCDILKAKYEPLILVTSNTPAPSGKEKVR